MKYSEFVTNLFNSETEGPTKRAETVIQLLHASMGLTGEAGEVSELVKKYIFYGKEPDLEKLKHELGDVMFYLQAAINAIGSSTEEIETLNRTKLLKRYENGKYSNQAAIERKDVK